MNPFELTKDQYGSITVRIKSECVVLTREEARRIEERFIGISGENAKLRKYAKLLAVNLEARGCYYCPYEDEYEAWPCEFGVGECKAYRELRELGVLDE